MTSADRSSEPRQLVSGDAVWMEGVQWSPKSEWIAWSDNINRLRAMEIASERLVDIDQTGAGALNDFSWSADSEWIAYAKNSPNTVSAIWLYSFDSGRTTKITDDMTDESSPAFDPNGEYLYFVSARDFSFNFGGGSNFNARIFAATLKAESGHPFPPKSDEEPAVVGEAGEEEEGDDESSLTIDLAGLGDRIMPLPGIEPGGYQGIIPVDDGLLYFLQSGDSLVQDLNLLRELVGF